MIYIVEASVNIVITFVVQACPLDTDYDHVTSDNKYKIVTYKLHEYFIFLV